jgi:hypothetical protein
MFLETSMQQTKNFGPMNFEGFTEKKKTDSKSVINGKAYLMKWTLLEIPSS